MGKKIYRDDSPANSKKSHPETPVKHIKTARKVIDGEYVSMQGGAHARVCIAL